VADRVVIEGRYNGPPGSGNGGYACGLAGTVLDGPARVSLRRPPPLDVPLERRREDDGSVSLLDGDALVATAVREPVRAAAPPAPSVEQAEIAARAYPGFEHHVFPTCFVCGPARFDDGLRIYPGRVGEGSLIACPWTPPSADPLLVWAALDCPTAFVCDFDRMGVLASLTLDVREAPAPGEAHVVAAWPVGRDGRKHHAASALYDAGGRVLAVADALWIEVRDPAAFGG
jgi:hypothetical protein